MIQSRLLDPETVKFRADLGFSQINLIPKKGTISSNTTIKNIFFTKIKLQHKALEKKRVRTDMYFSEHKFAVEIDKKRHIDRNQDKENKRQTKIENHSYCKFFHRINLDAEGFDIFPEISKMQNYISQSNKEKLKSKFAKELLSYVSSISKPLKHIRYFVKKVLSTL